MFQSVSSKIARAGHSSKAVQASEPPPLASLFSADDAERQLAEELEKVLKLRPVLRTIHLEPAPEELGKTANKTPLTSAALSEALAAAAEMDDGFEWQTRDSAPQQPADAAQQKEEDLSLQWVAKARADRRRRAVKNAIGWLATLVVGCALLGGTAYELMGWQPDMSWLLQIGQRFAA